VQRRAPCCCAVACTRPVERVLCCNARLHNLISSSLATHSPFPSFLVLGIAASVTPSRAPVLAHSSAFIRFRASASSRTAWLSSNVEASVLSRYATTNAPAS
jgi:hypothetical protein